MPTSIHAAGPTGQRSPGLDAAIAAWHAENPGIGGGVELVEGVVDLDGTGSPVREFYCTDAATIEGVAFAAGTAVVFRRTPAGVWGYIVVDPWTNIAGGTTTTTTTAATTTTTTTAATTTTTTTAATTTTTTTAAAPVVVDTFTRADGALGLADTGQAWETSAAGWSVTSNEARFSGTTDTYAVIDSGLSDGYFVQFTVRELNGTWPVAIVGRYVDTSNYIKVFRVGGYWQSNVNGTTGAQTASTLAVGDTIRLEVSGTSYVLKRNGTAVYSFTSAAHPAVTKQGFSGSGNLVTRVDDYTVGTI